MSKADFSLNDFKNPDFRPMRKCARAIYTDLMKTHAGPMPLDESPFNQEIIELALDARMIARSMLSNFRIKTTTRGERCSDLVYRQYIEHCLISEILNTVDEHFEFRPVAGIVGYHWHDDPEKGCESKDSYYINAGARVFDASNGVIPVVWSESMMCSWSHTQEVKRDLDHAKAKGEIDDEEADEELRDAIQYDSDFEQDFEDAERRVISFNIAEAATGEVVQPVRIDTCMYDLFKQPQIQDGKFKKLLVPPEIVVSPMYRGNLCSARYEANGAFTAMMHRKWGTNEPIESMTAMIRELRTRVYRIWQGEEE